MAMAKRIFLFLAINFLVVITISIVLSILGVRPYLQAHGIDYKSLAIFCLIWGMGGAFISLGLSRIMAKWLMGVRIIQPQTSDPQMQKLVNMVHRLAQEANLPAMPEVGIYESPEVNAFATGPTKKRALVAVSTGLLHRLTSGQLEAVLAHEISHISNGDMVTMTLIQGIVNAFVMFLARILAYAFSGLGRSREEGSGGSIISYTIMVFVFEILFMILGSLIVAAFSRWREFRADAGGARLAGRDRMIGALEALQSNLNIHDPRHEKPAFDALKISTRSKSGFLSLFASHPPIEERIARLRHSS